MAISINRISVTALNATFRFGVKGRAFRTLQRKHAAGDFGHVKDAVGVFPCIMQRVAHTARTAA